MLGKGKPAAEGGSTAGQFTQCTHKYGFEKVALQDVALYRNTGFGTCAPRWLPPSNKPPRGTVLPL
jgi:hypothetical protein